MREIIALLLTGLLLSGCDKYKETEKTKAEFGICYDARGCPRGQESAFSVTKNACDAASGKSWKGGTSGCVNL